MQRFAELYRQLDETTKTGRKIDVMRAYFQASAPADAAWAVYFLSGRTLKRLVLVRNLRRWCCEAGGVPEWLFDECVETVGDLAETIALLLPPPAAASDVPLSRWLSEVLHPLQRGEEAVQRELLIDAWSRLTPPERFVFNKLVTGSFRVGVSQGLVVRALAEVAGVSPQTIAHRLMGNWQPTPEAFQALLSPESAEVDLSKPYPFCLAHPLQAELSTLGEAANWLVEWKWDGIRGQLIRRHGVISLWSRGDELILDRFPEIAADVEQLPGDMVLDGEIVGWKGDSVLPFSDLQKRIGRKNLTKKILADIPARFMAFDVLEVDNADCRSLPMGERRQQLQQLLQNPGAHPHVVVSPRIEGETWEQIATMRDSSRERQVEGFMLKRLDSPYGVGRVTGLWWKWKIDPFSCDAVLIYAQRGHGRRASLYSDYTFGVWQGHELVPFAKAYSGLSDEEIREVDLFVRRNTLEKFGPVHVVKPELVFELAFEGIQRSTRHKSGIAVRFPRMARWRRDKLPRDADSLATIRALIPSAQPVED